MKKIFWVLLIFTWTNYSDAQLLKSSKEPVKIVPKAPPTNPHLLAARKYFKDDYYSVALYHLMELVKEEPQKIEQWSELIDKVLDKTGTLPLYVYDPNFIQQLKSSTVSLHLAHLAYKGKHYDETMARIAGVDSKISYYPEALLLKGTTQDVLRKGDALASFDQCIEEANKYTGITKNTKYKRYFILMREQCIINKARIFYRQGKYQLAIDTYDLIEKTSYSWPYILLDKAWSYYKLKAYNRSLGVVMTYRSPLLESYFLPESEILQALNYFRLCLYNDSALVIDQFYKVYSEKAKMLKAIIDKNANSEDYFFNLLMNDENEATVEGPYLKSLRNQLRKQLKINIHLGSYQRASEELAKYSKKYPNAPEKIFLTTALGNMKKLINRHTKEYIYYFLNSINYYSYEMFNIKLEIISRKKDLVYENKRLISNRARGTFDGMDKSADENFFNFNGEFWADELGDYSFGLKSNCKTLLIPDKDEKKDQVKEPVKEKDAK